MFVVNLKSTVNHWILREEINNGEKNATFKVSRPEGSYMAQLICFELQRLITYRRRLGTTC